MPKIYHDKVSTKTDSPDSSLIRKTEWNAAFEYANAAGTGPSGTDALIREQLTANRTYYVRKDGSDSNTGLADNAGGAFLTVQKGIDSAAALDGNGWTTTVQVRTGTYTENVGLSPTIPVESYGLCILKGEAGVVIAGKIYCANYNWSLDTLKVQNASGTGIEVDGGFLYIVGAMEYGACTAEHIDSHNHGVAYLNSNYTISGGATKHWTSQSNSLIRCRGATITLTGTPAFSTSFADADHGRLQVDNNTFSGSATGVRFTVADGGSIELGTTSVTYFPGNATGTISGGFYGNILGTTAGVLTDLNPSVSDAAALGTTSLKWSDLFLASGAVINFNSGDVTITHSADVLAFAGAATRYSFDFTVTPAANDGAALGTSALMWSDLFLASGSIINWNNSDLLLTHSADVLTLTGGSLHISLSAFDPASNDDSNYRCEGSSGGGFLFYDGANRAGFWSRNDGTNQNLLFGCNGTSSGFTGTDGNLRLGPNQLTLGPHLAIPAGGTASKGYMFSSSGNFGVFFGSGAPSLSAFKGSLYLRSDATTNVTRAYINTDGGTVWTGINTVA